MHECVEVVWGRRKPALPSPMFKTGAQAAFQPVSAILPVALRSDPAGSATRRASGQGQA